ncbi:hypothetical protein [Marinifilum fragile]|uniref:hypothetical protein n=1 Tax=Marinifilum fragile TaxID=570161 RepID=UPI002AABCA57|nr:hypothetical protein [Marinifilum fragile]
MKLNKLIKIAFFTILVAYSGYLFVESARSTSFNWIFYTTLSALIFYITLLLYVIWALLIKRMDEREKKKMKKSYSIILGLIEGGALGWMHFADMDLKYIFLLAPIIAISFAFILTGIRKMRVEKQDV